MKIGIDLGGSHIGIGVIENNGKIIEKVETDLNKSITNNIEEFMKEYITKNIKMYIKKYNVNTIGIASPGTPKNGKITTLVNLGIDEFNITKLIEEITNIPVTVHNDAKCAAIAEKKYGALKSYADSVFICLGTGIGGAVFINNELLTPKRNPGFELGHMIIEKDGNLCNCGKKGCFETYCSMKRLKNKLIDTLKLKKETTAQELLEILKNDGKIAENVINEYLNNDSKKIESIIDEYLNNLIIGLSNIIDIFEPEAICLGGSFVYFEEILFEKLVEKYYEKRYTFNKENLPSLKLAKLGNDAGIIGAPELLMN